MDSRAVTEPASAQDVPSGGLTAVPGTLCPGALLAFQASQPEVDPDRHLIFIARSPPVCSEL